MAVDLAIGDVVKQLRRAGLRPSERMVQTILAQSEVAVGPLLDLARNIDLLHEDEPACWAPIHALRLLGEIRPIAMIEPLLDMLPIPMHRQEERPVMIWAQEIPQILGRIGAPAIEPLSVFADDPAHSEPARNAAISALSYAVVVAPERRDEVVAWMCERFRSSDDPALVGYLVLALSQLGVSEAYREIMDAYRHGRIDRDVAPPAAVRQWLLSKIEKRLACVRHPLWERYDEHGPFTKEQYEMMDQMEDDEAYR